MAELWDPSKYNLFEHNETILKPNIAQQILLNLNWKVFLLFNLWAPVPPRDGVR